MSFVLPTGLRTFLGFDERGKPFSRSTLPKREAAPRFIMFDAYYCCLLLGLDASQLGTEGGSEDSNFLNAYPDAYKGQAELIAGLLVEAELRRLDIGPENREDIEREMVRLLDLVSPHPAQRKWRQTPQSLRCHGLPAAAGGHATAGQSRRLFGRLSRAVGRRRSAGRMTTEAAPPQPELLIRPYHITFAKLFNGGTHQAPRYQRNYAWQAEEIAAFLKDLDLCRRARMEGRPRHHFFGGVVTAVAPVQGSDRPNLEVIDGQQRLATVLMLINQLGRAMAELAGRLDPPEAGRSAFLTKTAQLLRERYELYEDTIEFNIVPVPRLGLSLPDRGYFSSLLAGAPQAVDRRSHELLTAAFANLGDYLHAQLAAAADDESPDFDSGSGAPRLGERLDDYPHEGGESS